MADRNPLQQVQAVFQQGRPVFMPYYSVGYPDLPISIDIMEACAQSGADLIEIGLPFSDPLADGPVIQHSTQIALENGVTTTTCLEVVRELRSRGVEIPLILMGYFNPICTYGLENFVEEARESGANGFIIPDLPPQEGKILEQLCDQYQMAVNYLLGPNSSEERIKLVTSKCTGFVYLVSVTGITGERGVLPEDLKSFVSRVRKHTEKPLAVGFGISTPEHVKAVGEIADGIIVGSALIRIAQDEGDLPGMVGKFVRAMSKPLMGN
ncbi:MAG: tryptophan synthase subunit alpha [Anaerolineales bacterium]|nr:tryptophan synthase subunit alpha [Anaerolineales bacterium]